jgi:VWFA-related protein
MKRPRTLVATLPPPHFQLAAAADGRSRSHLTATASTGSPRFFLADAWTLTAVALLLLASMALLVAPARAAQPEGQTFEEAVEVREVILDVLVSDRGGRPVLGLGKDDFTVTEGGKPVALTSATFYSTHRLLQESAPSATGALAIDQTPRDRYYLLFFHDQRTAAAEVREVLSRQLQALRDARRWVSEKQPNDWIAVASFDYKLKLYTDFSRDTEVVLGALDRVWEAADPGAEWPSRVDAATEPLRAGLPRGKELGRQTPLVYDALRLLGEAAGAVPGRKNLIYFGFGFGRLNGFGQFLPDERYYPKMMRTLNDANVAVYTVDTLGPESQHLLAQSLTLLAADTGGRYFGSFTSFATPLGEIAKETDGYYLLTYRSPQTASKRERFQEVEVKVRNPSFEVRARSGYRVPGQD